MSPFMSTVAMRVGSELSVITVQNVQYSCHKHDKSSKLFCGRSFTSQPSRVGHIWVWVESVAEYDPELFSSFVNC